MHGYTGYTNLRKMPRHTNQRKMRGMRTCVVPVPVFPLLLIQLDFAYLNSVISNKNENNKDDDDDDDDDDDETSI